MPRKKADPSKKLPVKLREKKLTGGKIALYLDYYNPKTGKREYDYFRNATDENGQRLNGLYIYPTAKGDKEAERINTRTRLLAESICTEWNKQILSGAFNAVKETKLLLNDWMMHCAAEAEKEADTINRSTWGNTIRLTAELIKAYTNNERTRLSDVDEIFVQGFIDYLRHEHTIERGGERQPLAQGTIHKRYQCLHYVLEKAVRKGYIVANPCNRLERKERPKAPQSTREHLTVEELKTLEATPSRSKVRDVYLFMCFCGLRISDVKALRWADVDTSGQQWAIEIRMQKTKEPLYLPLCNKAREYMPQRGEAAATDPVFADLPSEPALNRALKMWAKSAKIEKTLTLHTARHTFATIAVSLGVPIYIVSKLLGHTNVTTTQIYAKIADRDKAAAVNVFDTI